MTAKQKKALLARYFEMWAGDSKMDPAEICAEDCRDHMPRPGPDKLDGVRAAVLMFRAAFPDSRVDCLFTSLEGDLVAGRAHFEGTHTGHFMDISPSGEKVEMDLVDLVRIDAAGKIAEIWHLEDMLALMTQLGIVSPATGGRTEPL